MAVDVNTVYKTVLYILNKEQRGYLTPAEFNSVAAQVQLEIFEQYFEDLNVQLRMPENDSEYANRQKTIKEKISFFETNKNITGSSPFLLPNSGVITATLTVPGTGYVNGLNVATTTSGMGIGCTVDTITAAGAITTVTIAEAGEGYTVGDVLTIVGGNNDAEITITSVNGPTLHRLGTIEYLPQKAGFSTSSYNPVEVQEVSQHEFNLIRRSSLTTPSFDWPIFTLKDNKVITLPNLDNVEVYYVRKPKNPVWSYKVGSLGQYIYDPAGPIGKLQNFEISNLEQTELILKILAYTGVIIRDANIVTTATQMAINEDNLEKQ